MLLIVLLIKHGRDALRCILGLVAQAMLFLLNKLLLESLEEKTIHTYKILNKLLLFIHGLKSYKHLFRDVGTGNLHSYCIISLLHLRHIN